MGRSLKQCEKEKKKSYEKNTWGCVLTIRTISHCIAYRSIGDVLYAFLEILLIERPLNTLESSQLGIADTSLHLLTGKGDIEQRENTRSSQNSLQVK